MYGGEGMSGSTRACWCVHACISMCTCVRVGMCVHVTIIDFF